MKLKFLAFLQLLCVYKISAQLAITTGTELSLSGNTQLTLLNTDLVNNGTLKTGTSRVSFTGNASSRISGVSPVQFFNLETGKDANTSVLLQQSIGVTGAVFFSSGFLNLNGFNLDLGTSGHLDGEDENSRVIGPTGGEILFNTNLNSPTGSNPANLGAFITSGLDLGNVTIRRGHKSQLNNNPGSDHSILRYYEILPGNNADPNATIRFRYMNGELNGLDENSIVQFESQDAINWANLGFTSRDTVANFVEKNGISRFGRFTLFGQNTALPSLFTSFNAKCEGNAVQLSWKTAQEQNSSHFEIGRSVDGVQWTVIGSVPAAGNSAVETSYSFTDNNPIGNGYYRIAKYDLDGRSQFTSLLRSSCDGNDLFSVGPNPVTDKLFINITAGNSSPIVMKLFDSKGSLVRKQEAVLLTGSNQLSLDLRSLSTGIYHLSLDWNKGKTRKTVSVMKH